MTFSSTEELEAFSTKTMALLFTPFHTKIVYYESLVDLLAEHFPSSIQPSARYPMDGVSGLDQVDVYSGEVTGVRLGNMWRFLDYNGINTINVGLCYDKVLVVGRNLIADLEVDIPISRFPWLRAHYNYSIHGDANFFLGFPEKDLFNYHRLLVSCVNCRKAKKRCNRQGLVCGHCTNMNMSCDAVPEEGPRRNRESYAGLRKDVDILCPMYQYTINLFGRRYGDGIYHTNVVAALANQLVGVIPVTNRTLVDSIVFHCNSYQNVSIMAGEIRVVESRNVEDLWGFDVDVRGSRKRDKMTMISPHLGMHTPHDAYSLINSILETPGEIFYRDTCIVTRKFKAQSVRLMAMAEIYAANHVMILLGWRFPFSN
jgi:hypothetical protein